VSEKIIDGGGRIEYILSFESHKSILRTVNTDTLIHPYQVHNFLEFPTYKLSGKLYVIFLLDVSQCLGGTKMVL